MKFYSLVLFLAALGQLVAQTSSLHGQVTDESGALVIGARVALKGPGGKVSNAISANDGSYSFDALPPGNYVLQASAPQLMLAPAKLSLKAGSHTLNLRLKVASTEQRVTVQDNAGNGVSADASNNASALVLRGDDLQALADNPEDLAADLLALAGPSAGPNGGAIYIDGFSGGQLPSKESIREIRINQNPFSPEYDKLGFGRIEIFTKPGSEKFKVATYYNFGHDSLNTRNPYARTKAPFLLKEYGGSVSGPMNKHSAFFLDVRRDSIDNGAIINGIALDPDTLGIVSPFTDVYRIPQRRITVTPRADYQLNANNTLTARYSFSRADVAGSGVGSFNLVSRGVHAENTSHTVQVTETAVLGSSVVNETRFQFFRADISSVASTSGPAINVLGSFNGGGATVGHSSNLANSYEFQNYTSIARGAHAWRFGVRVRGESVDDISPQNFNGTFTFGGGLTPAGEQITSIERYRRTLLYQRAGFPASQIRALGGGATQYSVNAGDPAISASQADVGVFAGDDWRVRSNITVSLGLRYETQTNIHDWRDLAPRAGIAWAPGGGGKSKPKTVVRAGFGMFYDRFGLANTITASRYNGVLQRQFVIDNPDVLPGAPSISLPTQSQQTVQVVSSTLRAPYILQTAAGFERQLPLNITLALTYANAHGLHMLRSRTLSLTGFSPVLFLMESSGLYNQNQLITSVNAKVNKNISLFGSYVVNDAKSNTDGLGTFPANPNSFIGEYGPASTDVRHRVIFGGSITTKWDIRLSPLLTAESGPPFDITVGRDVYGNTLFNGRPGIATDPRKTGVIQTSYGLLDPNPSPDEKLLPRNYGRGPGAVQLNLRFSKTFAFGFGEGHEAPTNIPGGGDRRRDTAGVFTSSGSTGAPAKTNHRYNLTFSLSIRNMLNHTNPGAIIGNITSPLFGQANQSAGSNSLGGTNFSEAANNRRLELQTRFTF